MKKLILVLALLLFYGRLLYAQSLSFSIGTGFGNENKPIEILEGDYFSLLLNRKIEYVKAAQIIVDLTIDDHLDFGLDISYTWATLDWQGQLNVGGPTINELGWTSFGCFGRYSFFIQKRLQIGAIATTGVHMGYPKRMNLDTVEKQVKFYAGLYAGPQFKISDHFMIAYYYGRGKYNNSILLTYSL